jgi:hypothetical protein
MTRTLLTVALFVAALATTGAAALAADITPRKTETPATVDVYKDPG